MWLYKLRENTFRLEIILSDSTKKMLMKYCTLHMTENRLYQINFYFLLHFNNFSLFRWHHGDQIIPPKR